MKRVLLALLPVALLPVALLPVSLLLVAVPVMASESSKVSLGVFDRWGAFSDPSPRRCYAIAQPVRPGDATGPGGRRPGGILPGGPRPGGLQSGGVAPVVAAPAARWRPFASIATWPGQGARNQLHLRLSRERDPRARVTLSVGERRFALIAGSADAWSPDKRTDAAVVAALRSGRSMSVETLSKTGQPFADVYPLRGAATAIDAASLGCARG